MSHRFRAALAALLLLGSSLTHATPALATHQGLCFPNEWSGGNTAQYYFEKNTSQTPDYVYGWVTDRPLFPCEGVGITQGLSFTAAANVQSDTHGGIYIFQLGIGQIAGQGGDQNYFIRTPNSGSGVATLITSPRPAFGQRCQFRIFENASGNIHYQIRNSGNTVLYSASTGTPWTADVKHMWWGWEALNSKDMPGHHAVDASADMVGQYSWNGSSTITTMTNITIYDSCPSPCNFSPWLIRGGTDGSIFNVEN